MLLIHNRSHDPYYNMAMEEFLLLHKKQEAIMLWRNSPAVIVGYHQNAIEEVDTDFIKQHNIRVVRRLTGGGAVFHDLGNINFTFIEQTDNFLENSYARFTKPIIDYLNSLGIKAELSGRNDLTIDGQKFSGNAQVKKENFMMHHGTLLYQADFKNLTGALKPKEIKIASKGIKSVRSRVTNIASHLPQPMTIEDFLEGLYQFFMQNGAVPYSLTKEETQFVQRLAKEKYSTWDWNFGISPSYQYQNSAKFPFGIVDVRFQVTGGKMQQVRIFGDFFAKAEIAELEHRLNGCPHEQKALQNCLNTVDIDKYIIGMKNQEFIDFIL